MRSIIMRFLTEPTRIYFRLRLGFLGQNVRIHSSVKLSDPKRISVGDGCSIGPNVALRANTEHPTGIRIGSCVTLHDSVLIAANKGSVDIGDRSWLAPFALVYGNGHVKIGNDVLIAPRVSISTVSHHSDRCDIPINDQGIYSNPVIIDNDVWIGLHAVILQGVTIGRGTIIGAGAVVTRDIPAWSIAVGIPAKVIGRRKNAPAGIDR